MRPGAAPGRLWAWGLVGLEGALLAGALLGLPAARWGLTQPLLLTEGWRLVSCVFVHGPPLHLLGNGVGLVLLAALGWRAALTGRDLLAFALAAPLGHALLLVRDDWSLYFGASGALHAAAALVGLGLLRAAAPRERRIGQVFLAVLGLKLLLEAPWGPSLRQEALWGGFSTLPLAHSTGAVAGLALGLLFSALDRKRQ
ncbi:rhomboid family intramembrane serine protease [Inhella gelatinilytica]|uniref:Rhomboid family intramembrane serine protease n=1 Tax=Inhella gelatinilytica TaxID=2795030 RepID=A0A931IS75_9BURK|nr:rhomboid family intramembrane serine protease [Inhella gelatinilytica]MBH9551710.1 rhomboid family intramembrane serine protease [Inhella gelatinilytica]